MDGWMDFFFNLSYSRWTSWDASEGFVVHFDFSADLPSDWTKAVRGTGSLFLYDYLRLH